MSPLNFRDVARKAAHEVKKAEHSLQHIEHAVKKTATSISHAVTEAEREAKIEAFLAPVRRSRVGSTPAYSRLKAILEYRSEHGQDPNEFLSEMIGRSKKVLGRCAREIHYVTTFLRTVSQGNNRQRLQQEVLRPVRAGTMTCSEGWDRMSSIVGYPVLGTGAGPSSTVGVGGAIGVSAVIGLAEVEELIGMGTLSFGIYKGVECSVGIQAGVNADVIMEIGFVPPINFGGPYWGIGIAGAYGWGGIFEVSWSLPAVQIPRFPDDSHDFQGFTVGLGAGIEVEGAWFLGNGTVQQIVPSSPQTRV